MESLVRRYFKFFYPDLYVEYNVRPDWLKNPSTGKNLELDIFYPTIGLAIEVNGFLHYKSDYQRDKDTIKKVECKRRGIKLMRIGHLKNLLSKGYLDNFFEDFSIRWDITKLPYSLRREIRSYRPVHTEWGRKKMWYLKKIDNPTRRYSKIQTDENELNRIKYNLRNART